MNILWTNSNYIDRPAYASTVVHSNAPSEPLWPDQRILVNWQWALNSGNPTNYMLGLTGHRIGFDELRPEVATAVNWQQVANSVTVEWLIAVQWIWHPSLAGAIVALRTNPLIRICPELYCFAWNRTAEKSCQLEAVNVLNQLAAIPGALTNASPILIATDSLQYGLTSSYSSVQPDPGIKFWRDRGLIQRAWYEHGIRSFGVWGWEYTTPASRLELAQAFSMGINGQLLPDLSAWR